MAALKAKRLVVGTFDGLRVLGDGELTKKLTVKADHFSKSAEEKIEKAGGSLRTAAEAEEAGPEQDGVEEEGDQGRRGCEEGPGTQDYVKRYLIVAIG